jgi:hypothetical protein
MGQVSAFLSPAAIDDPAAGEHDRPMFYAAALVDEIANELDTWPGVHAERRAGRCRARLQCRAPRHRGAGKSGGSACTDDVYVSFIATMNSLPGGAPAAFTPGDNDWTDCDRDGVHSSAERLDFERKLFFSTPFTFGQHKLRQEV